MIPEVHVSAAVVVDAAGRALVVRKRGARVFQQPGGKPDPGETALQAVVREVAEETGIAADAASFVPLGRYTDAAANEPGHRVVADAFLLRVDAVDAQAAGEIAQLRWITEEELDDVPLAPLSRNHLIRHAWL
ncbi:NUDIX domain-containing protein [Microbacterium sp. BWT-B31]|uniref:NUDIX hydrolase n=1 Tax=Microbacterium sp. BWT-B31 TaxID=3232072 RepID=UPI0035288A1E